MKCLKWSLLIAVFVILSNQIPAFAQKNNVFGMKVGESFAIKECPAKLVEKKFVGGPKYWVYEYDLEAPSFLCFTRSSLYKTEYRKKNEIPSFPLPLPRKQFVQLSFPANAQLDFVVSREIYAYIYDDDTLEAIVFRFHKNNIQAVFDTLNNKYGAYTKKTPMRWQNELGATYDYEIVEWRLSGLFIKYQNAGGYLELPGDVPDYNNPFKALWGMASISVNREQKDNGVKIPL